MLAMKPLLVICIVIIPILRVGCAAQVSNEAGSDCGSSPRVVGAFGAMDKPVPAVSISEAVKNQLSDLKVVRAVRRTDLAPSGEQIVMYDTSTDEFAPKQRIAVISDGKVISNFEVTRLVAYGEQAIYQTSCEFEVRTGQKGFVVAYLLSGDGTGSAFILLTHTARDYRVVFARIVGQGRLVFKVGTFDLWERTFDKRRQNAELDNFECEWCDHRYRISKYSWNNGSYVKVASTRTKNTYEPAAITGTPVIIGSPEAVAK